MLSIQLTIILLCILGENIRRILPFFTQNYIEYIKERRWKIGILTFILGYQISSIISATGAFEIFCNDVEIFSKLKSNTMPSIDLILTSIVRLGYSLQN